MSEAALAPVEGARGLRARDFVRIADGGFGDPQNSLVEAMAWFQERLYVAITRHAKSEPDRSPMKGGSKPGGPGVSHRSEYLDQPGQIWRYDHVGDRWDRMFVSPIVTLTDGRRVYRDTGYRKLTVLQGPSDPAPALYLSAISIFGSLILRSDDGARFMPVPQPDLDRKAVWSYRALAPFKGRLHASPAGRIQGALIDRNAAATPVLFQAADPAMGQWIAVSEPGFGDRANQAIYELGALDGCLYAGTYNPERGFQVWKTRADRRPYDFTQVIADGASRGASNQAATTLCAFGDALYVGTGQRASRVRRERHGASGGGEIVRVRADDSWELVVGERRLTSKDVKTPLSGLGPGFGNPNNGIIWNMTEHDGWLYAGTVNTASFVATVGRSDLRGRASRLTKVVDQILERDGGFEVWRSRDGTAWEPVTRSGFGNRLQFGVQSMLSTPIGLVIGTGGMTRGRGSWPGGCSVWLGR
jgi:hypothetical protein